MIGYKKLAEFFERVALYEGRTDLQSHIGIDYFDDKNAEDIAADFFKGKLITTPKITRYPYRNVLYVYHDNFWTDFIKKYPGKSDTMFEVEDVTGQRITCWGID